MFEFVVLVGLGCEADGCSVEIGWLLGCDVDCSAFACARNECVCELFKVGGEA